MNDGGLLVKWAGSWPFFHTQGRSLAFMLGAGSTWQGGPREIAV
jgi:hypothetical protein